MYTVGPTVATVLLVPISAIYPINTIMNQPSKIFKESVIINDYASAPTEFLEY